MTALIDVLVPPLPLVGRHALITGGGHGIGRAISLELARQGAAVTIGYNTRGDQAEMTMREVRAYGGDAEILKVALVNEYPILTELDCDILVNNAGVTAGRSVGKTTLSDWRNVVDVNLTGTFRITQIALPAMIARGWGRIVNIVSVVGLDGRLGPASYAASKAGLVGFTKATAIELAHKGITVNAVAPGFIDRTGMLSEVSQENREKVLSQIPMRRFGQPQDVARAVMYLIESNYVTGTVLNVSGGYST